jgi:hypothetical protein
MIWQILYFYCTNTVTEDNSCYLILTEVFVLNNKVIKGIFFSNTEVVILGGMGVDRNELPVVQALNIRTGNKEIIL